MGVPLNHQKKRGGPFGPSDYQRWPSVELGDIKEAYGFVAKCIAKSGIKVQGEEYDEMMCEGIVILCALHDRYDASKDTGPKASFAGYAWYLLPRKLKDAWHKLHPEHVMRTQPDGKRKYEYHQAPVSIDARGTSGERSNRSFFDQHTTFRTPGEFVSVPTAA